MTSPKGESGRTPATVAASWRRIEAWIGSHLPIQRLTLRPGISKKDLAKYEAILGRTLPDDVRESWLIHDGQRWIDDQAEHPDFNIDDADNRRVQGLVFGGKLLPLLDDRKSLAGRSSSREWREWARRMDEDPSLVAEIGEGCASFPGGAIQHLYSSRGWIPLVEVLSSVRIGVDLMPGPEGTVGQVINFGRDAQDRYVLAVSWAHFLEDLADELDAGNFALIDDGERAFGMARPVRGAIDLNFRAWAEAKREGRLLE
ncbi:SMI1 / KNR4 family protein [Aquisphaera giovannonii]|uniref:SMI1 / KNR4 family protein n=1 Tax=Aquisphaera giovannonii TaxID=406548 RepID=A0A5B9WFR0_9BACT|nr:SMI1/KNR4 family protein [Aquisphaera giovannonii]QEH39084.1 SMI1 / KNR4 family protein [Aquisphaera giovannonii]